jgi:hypothetical protein
MLATRVRMATGGVVLPLPTFVAAATPVGDNVASKAINKPTGTLEGDVMVTVVHTASDRTITPPSGWTHIHTSSVGDHQVAVYRKVAGASEPGSYTWGISSSTTFILHCLTYRGVDSSTPVDDEATAGSASTSSLNAPSVTTGRNRMVLVAAGFKNSTTVSTPSGTTSRSYFEGNGASTFASSRVCDFAQESAGATGAKTFSFGSTNAGDASTVALAPG